jgi:HlyD family secretion protein
LNQKKKQSINNEIEILKNKIRRLENREANQKDLLEKGLITRRKFLATREEIDSAWQKISSLKNQRKELPLKLLNLKEQQEQKIRNKATQINAVQRDLISLKERLEQASKVLSTYSGRILELAVSEGSRIQANSRIASLEPMGHAVEDLQAVLYVPADQGKKIEPGMEARISPSTVEAEKFGMMLGLVTQVGEFPATREGMMRLLRNEKLVQLFAQRGSPLEVLISPIPSPATFSGYKWTSSKGPQEKILSGTMNSGSIAIQKQAPITLVIPWLRKNVLGVGAE